jgi:hypothetical protein
VEKRRRKEFISVGYPTKIYKNSYIMSNETIQVTLAKMVINLPTVEDKMTVINKLLEREQIYINTFHMPHNQCWRSVVTGPYQEGDGGTLVPHGFSKFSTKWEAYMCAFEDLKTTEYFKRLK